MINKDWTQGLAHTRNWQKEFRASAPKLVVTRGPVYRQLPTAHVAKRSVFTSIFNVFNNLKLSYHKWQAKHRALKAFKTPVRLDCGCLQRCDTNNCTFVLTCKNSITQ